MDLENKKCFEFHVGVRLIIWAKPKGALNCSTFIPKIKITIFIMILMILVSWKSSNRLTNYFNNVNSALNTSSQEQFIFKIQNLIDLQTNARIFL